MTALVLDVFESGDKVGDASEAQADTGEGGPGAEEDLLVTCSNRTGLRMCCHSLGGVPAMMFRPRQRPHATARAIDGGRGLLEVLKRYGDLVSALLGWLLLHGHMGLGLRCRGLGWVIFLLLLVHGRGSHWLLRILLLLGVLLDSRVVVGAGFRVISGGFYVEARIQQVHTRAAAFEAVG